MKSNESNPIFKQTMAGVSLSVRMTAFCSNVINPRPLFRKARCNMWINEVLQLLVLFVLGFFSVVNTFAVNKENRPFGL